ncbi:hypothetical protein ACK33S_19280 [Aeromonas hydrophila]|uniref:hypothetical protein n=1 Tax=Aeromonas hydrophila TaxID=644 RepID=UPI003988A194
MKRQTVLATLLPLLLCANGAAQEQVQQVTWQAAAIKDSQSTMALVHPGQQPIVASGEPGQELAVRVTSPEGGLSFQARMLITEIDAPTVSLNGKNLTHDYQPVLAADRYYLGYQHKGSQTNHIIESGYELIAYWQS